MHARNVIAFFVAFVTEAVPLGELLHEEALFGLVTCMHNLLCIFIIIKYYEKTTFI